jgi:hypothetical protein
VLVDCFEAWAEAHHVPAERKQAMLRKAARMLARIGTRRCFYAWLISTREEEVRREAEEESPGRSVASPGRGGRLLDAAALKKINTEVERVAKGGTVTVGPSEYAELLVGMKLQARMEEQQRRAGMHLPMLQARIARNRKQVYFNAWLKVSAQPTRRTHRLPHRVFFPSRFPQSLDHRHSNDGAPCAGDGYHARPAEGRGACRGSRYWRGLRTLAQSCRRRRWERRIACADGRADSCAKHGKHSVPYHTQLAWRGAQAAREDKLREDLAAMQSSMMQDMQAKMAQATSAMIDERSPGRSRPVAPDVRRSQQAFEVEAVAPEFDVMQTHLPTAREQLVLRVAEKGLELCHDGAVKQRLRYADITRFRRMQSGAGISLSWTGEGGETGQEIQLGAVAFEGGNEIYTAIQAKIKEIVKAMQADATNIRVSNSETAALANKYLQPSSGISRPSNGGGHKAPEKGAGWLRKMSMSLAPSASGEPEQPEKPRIALSPHEQAMAEASVMNAVEEVVAANKTLREDLNALMRAGDGKWATEQMPKMSAKVDKAQADFQWNLLRLPKAMRERHEVELKRRIAESEALALEYDELKDSASPTEKKRMAQIARRCAAPH